MGQCLHRYTLSDANIICHVVCFKLFRWDDADHNGKSFACCGHSWTWLYAKPSGLKATHLAFGICVSLSSSTVYVLAVHLSIDFAVTMRTYSPNHFIRGKSSHTIVDKHNRLQAQKTIEGTFASSKVFYIRHGIKHWGHHQVHLLFQGISQTNRDQKCS